MVTGGSCDDGPDDTRDLRPGRIPPGGRLPEPAEPPGGVAEHRRIREDALDGVYVMAFSLLASTATALSLVFATRLVG